MGKIKGVSSLSLYRKGSLTILGNRDAQETKVPGYLVFPDAPIYETLPKDSP